MKTTTATGTWLMSLLCLSTSTVHAFTPTIPTTATATTSSSSGSRSHRMPYTHFAASVDEDTNVESLLEEEDWMKHMETKEVQDVRNELIQKYISLGRTQEYAEAEVDTFLSDPERSAQFLEMRRYAKANNDLGFEFIFQLGGAFALGLGANVVVKYFAAYKDVYPDFGSGPIPFL